ncbi:MAG TPA: response regulator transcription factor [Gudongella oleilytica]|jgi:DNA-binding response OmpR family regulator|nr:response regulator transcription factor [Gudongella oleilytica]
MTKILIVEDEEKLARFVELELQYEGYEVEKAFDGRAGIDMVKASPFDLVLLDIMLPGLNGIEVLRRIRQTSDIPVILLTARDAVVDKVTGLDSGADDYITKPFAIEELLARIRALLRKKEPGNQAQAKDVVVYKELTLDTRKREVHVKGTVVPLTKKEFDLLELLMENRNIVLSRETILDKIWGYDFSGGTNAVDVYIRYLRAKLEEPFGTKIFSTVRGVGYAIKDEDQ